MHRVCLQSDEMHEGESAVFLVAAVSGDFTGRFTGTDGAHSGTPHQLSPELRWVYRRWDFFVVFFLLGRPPLGKGPVASLTLAIKPRLFLLLSVCEDKVDRKTDLGSQLPPKNSVNGSSTR